MTKIKRFLKALGPGLLFAGAAIGVSHLVQSTRAGADYGFGLLWALVIIHIVKYPFFQFGAKYANATGNNLLEGYLKVHKSVLILYFLINLASMFTIQAAVTLVTTGLAMHILGISGNPTLVSICMVLTCTAILLFGKYKVLDQLIKFIIVALTITTIGALTIAVFKNTNPILFTQKIVFSDLEIPFLIAFLGWMPAPLDVSIWQSLWNQEKQLEQKSTNTLKNTVLDFNIGYITTLILGICFLAMGAIVMHNNGIQLEKTATGFSQQLIQIYTTNIGKSAAIFIAFAAFTTMFSTTLTALDASPRAMKTTLALSSEKFKNIAYTHWLLFLAFGTCILLAFFTNHMFYLIKIATIISFLTAPFFALINYKLITSKHTPKSHQPKLFLKVLSWFGILFLIGFSVWYLTVLLV